MRRIILALVMVILIAGMAFGLSDKEYKQMMKTSQAFREADRLMNESYKECKDTLPRSEFLKVQKEQREWLKNERDEEAEYFIKDGMTRTEAYANVTEMRADALHHICVTYRNEYLVDK